MGTNAHVPISPRSVQALRSNVIDESAGTHWMRRSHELPGPSVPLDNIHGTACSLNSKLPASCTIARCDVDAMNISSSRKYQIVRPAVASLSSSTNLSLDRN